MADLKQINYVSPEKLGYYDSKLKIWVAAADDAVKADLQAKIDAANQAISAEETRAKAAELANAQAAEAAQKAADDAQGHSEALAAKVGEVPADQTVMGIIQNIQENAYDDTEIRGLISDNADAIVAEKERAEGIEGGLETRLAAVEEDYLVEADKTELEGKIKTNTDAIAVLNGDGEGSVAKQVADAVAGIVDGAPEAYDTLKEISDWIAAHPESVAAINSAIQANTDAIDALEALVGTLPEGEDSANIVAYIQKLVNAEAATREAADNGLDTRLQAVEAKFTGDASVDSKIAAAEQNAKDYADELNEAMDGRVADLEAIDHEAYVAADAALKEELNAEIAKKANASTVSDMDAAYKLADTQLSGRLDVLEAINHDAYVAADTALETALKKYADEEDAKVEARVEALETASATHALASDVTALSQTHATDKQALLDADAALSERLDVLEATEHQEISTEEIDAWFA